MSLVKMVEVIVPAKTTRQFYVPEYDVPVLRLLWPQRDLNPGQQIEVRDYGMLQFRNLSSEIERIQRDYSTVPDGGHAPAWLMQFQSIGGIQSAWQTSVERAADMQRRVEMFKKDNPPVTSGSVDQEKRELRPLADNLEDDPDLEDEAIKSAKNTRKK